MSKRIARLAAICLTVIAIAAGIATLTSRPAAAGDPGCGGAGECPCCTTVDTGVACINGNGGGHLWRTTCWHKALGVCVAETTYSCHQ